LLDAGKSLPDSGDHSLPKLIGIELPTVRARLPGLGGNMADG
jgi:hypothetical protein